MKVFTINYTGKNSKNIFASSLILIFTFFVTSGYAATYYSKSSQSNPNNTSNWTINSDGSGSNPSSFTTAGDIFIVQTCHLYTTTAAWNVTGTIEVEGGLTYNHASSIGSLTIKNGGICIANAATTINGSGSFTIQDGGRYTLNHSSGNGASTFNGSESFSAASTFEYSNMTTSFVSNITYGNFIWNSSLSRSFPTTITINGNFEIKQGTLDFVSGRTIGGDATITGGSVTLYNTTINGAYNQTGGAAKITNENANRALTVKGSFNLQSGTFTIKDDSGATGGIQELVAEGDFSLNGGTLNFATGSNTSSVTRVKFHKDCYLISGGFGGFLSTIASSSGFYFQGNGEQSFYSAFSHSSGELRNMFYYKTSGGPTGLSEIYYGTIAQNTINGTFGTPASGYSRWPTTGPLIQNLTIDNSAGVTLRDDREINGTLILSNGLLHTGSCNNNTSGTMLAIGAGATVSGANSNSYVNGICRKIGNTSFSFPIGGNGQYAPIEISAPGSATDHFTACYNNTNPNTSYSVSSKESSLDHINTCEYWHLNRTNGNSNVNVTLSWDSRSCGVTNLSDLRVCRWDGSQWTNGGNGSTTGNTASGSITSSIAFSNFSPFTLGSSSSANPMSSAPLPTELLYFKGFCTDQFVDIQWATEAELQVDYFQLESSKDGIKWNNGSQQSAKGDGSTYRFTLAQQGTIYYRLLTVDTNGEKSYSPVISTHCESKHKEYNIFPNPVGDLLFISIPEEELPQQYSLIAPDGRIVKSGTITEKTEQINCQELPSGSYTLRINKQFQLILKY